MSPEEYRQLRRRVGSQEEVADALGIHPMTVRKRERGENPIDREAEFALRHLVQMEGENDATAER